MCKPFQSYLLNNVTHKREKVPLLLCIALHAYSHIFQDGGTKACAVPIRCQLTQSCASTGKTYGSSILCSSSLSVVCNDVLHRVSYHGTCIEICIVS